MTDRKIQKYLQKTRYNERIKLKNGTFLHTYCPKCSTNLIKNNEIELTGVTSESVEFSLKLSPYLDVFEHHSTIDIQPASVLKDLLCPHCGQSIVNSDIVCGACKSPTATLSVAAVHMRVPFLICLKEGCHWHGVTPEDEQVLIQDLSDEW